MDFNRTVTDPNGLTTDFGAGVSRVAMEMGPNGDTVGIAGIGASALTVSDGNDCNISGCDM